MLARELVSLHRIPTVISFAALASLQERLADEADPGRVETEAELRDLLGGFFLTDAHRQSLETILQSLAASDGRGAGFVVNGIYGSGKTHLLTVIALLAGHPASWMHFLDGREQYHSLAKRFPPERRLLVVPIALDEYPASADLEDIVFGRIQDELARPPAGILAPLTEEGHVIDLVERFVLPAWGERLGAFLKTSGLRSWEQLRAEDGSAAAEAAYRFLREEQIPLDLRRSRGERMAQLRATLDRHGYAGCLLLLDEASLFLGAKEKAALDRDASFLQFLGRQTATMPLWVALAMQRRFEDLGDIDSHSLRQIRDRFRSCPPLTITHLRTVIDRKMIRKRDPAAFAPTVAALHRDYAGGKPLSFSIEELAQTYPVHPMTLDLLERLAPSLLSQTRSLIEFVQEAIGDHGLDREADLLLTPDQCFDHFAPQLAAMPETRRHWEAYLFLRDHCSRAHDGAMGEEATLAERLIKVLVLAGLARLRWSVKELTDALCGGADRATWGDYERVHRVLEAVRRHAAYVEADRRQEGLGEVFFLDVTSDVSEVIRRRLHEITASFAGDDRRIWDHAVRVCAEESFPLAPLAATPRLRATWLQSRRSIGVSMGRLGRLTAEELVNHVGALASPGGEEDAQLYLGDFFDPAADGETWRRLAKATEGRFGSALIAWIPRSPRGDEREFLREAAARALLLDDPNLATNEQGREIRERLRADQSGIDEAARGLMRRLYIEGAVLDLEGEALIDAAQLAQMGWEETISTLADRTLSRVFPRFHEIAPARAARRDAVRQLMEEFVRPGAARPAPGSPLEGHLLLWAMPLGVVERSGDRFVLTRGLTAVGAHLLGLLPAVASMEVTPEQSVTTAQVIGMMAKSEFGLTPAQTEMLLAVLVRQGRLVALDAFLQPIRLERIGTPWVDSAPYLMAASALPVELHAAAQAMGRSLLGLEITDLDPPAQEELWTRLLAWKQETTAALPLLREGLTAGAVALETGPEAWAESLACLDDIAAVLPTIDPMRTGPDGLAYFLRAVTDSAEASSPLPRFRRLQQFLHDDLRAAMMAYAYLRDSRLRLPEKSMLVKQRERLLTEIATGEQIIADADGFRRRAEDFLRGYRNAYQAWHRQAYARLAELRALRETPVYRALARLSTLALDVLHDLRALEGALGQAMAGYCFGSDLPAVLDTAPVCPRCGLALGAAPTLVGAQEIETLTQRGVREYLVALRAPGVADLLRRRVEIEGNQVPTGVAEALALVPDADPETVVAGFQEEVVSWISRGLRSGAIAERSLDRLAHLLRGKRLTRPQVLDALTRWLDADRLDDNDLMSIE